VTDAMNILQLFSVVPHTRLTLYGEYCVWGIYYVILRNLFNMNDYTIDYGTLIARECRKSIRHKLRDITLISLCTHFYLFCIVCLARSYYLAVCM